MPVVPPPTKSRPGGGGRAEDALKPKENRNLWASKARNLLPAPEPTAGWFPFPLPPARGLSLGNRGSGERGLRLGREAVINFLNAAPDFFLPLLGFSFLLLERILKVRKKSGNRERCRKLSL